VKKPKFKDSPFWSWDLLGAYSTQQENFLCLWGKRLLTPLKPEESQNYPFH